MAWKPCQIEPQKIRKNWTESTSTVDSHWRRRLECAAVRRPREIPKIAETVRTCCRSRKQQAEAPGDRERQHDFRDRLNDVVDVARDRGFQ